MLVCGTGIGPSPNFIAGLPVSTGELAWLFPDAQGHVFDINTLYTSNLSLSGKLLVFIDALVQHLEDGSSCP